MKYKTTAALLSLVAFVALQSCRFGMNVESFPPARTPKGISGHILTSGSNYEAELIEVRDTGVVILASGIFRFVSYSAIKSSRFDGIGDSILERRAPSAKVREHLRLLSRFPQGLTPELLQQLLSASRQTELAQDKS